MAYLFVTEMLFFPVASTLIQYHKHLIVEYLVARKFHGWTYCTDVNLSQYYA
ncbi:unnamed protein product [Staurois parvus]|uniref:Uncharacterized protein n=1 Tax=Staurois parvus TaxID=386267 RepID=A0ABN9FUJ6_9NEOB|nr:unnamed protein product [Staurois parvus]